MKALSQDLRQRVVDALQQGQTRRQVAERFAISLSSVARLARQFKEQRHLQPKPIPGRTRAVRPCEHESLRALVAADKNATLLSLAAAFEQQTGRRVSISAMQRNLRWLENSHKKSRP
jgi:transposase